MAKKKTAPNKQNNNSRRIKAHQPPATAAPISSLAGIPAPVWFVLAVISGIIIYHPSLSAPFVFDDISSIVNNYAIHIDSFSAADLARLKTGLSGSRPLAMLTFALNYYFGKLNPFGYHALNIVIHILTAAAVYGLTFTTLLLPKNKEHYQDLARPVAMLCGFLFLLHPINTQAVAYTVQRMTSLACLFFVLSLLTYLRGRLSSGAPRCFWWVLAPICAICAFASKQNSATLPLYIVLYELYFFEPTPKRRRTLWAFPIIFVALAGYYTRFDFSDVVSRAAEYHNISYFQHILTQLRGVGLYLSLLVFPHPGRLNLDYDFPYSVNLFQPATTFLSLLLLIGLIFLCVKLFRRRPFISLGIAWFLGNLVIESGLVLADPIFEHRLYLPAIGVLWIISAGLITGWKKLASYNLWLRRASGFGIIAILVLFGTWSYQRNLIWADAVSLWQDTVNKSPDKARPRNNLANAYGSRGDYDKALIECERAIELDPTYGFAYHNMGIIYTHLGDDEKAIEYYMKAITLNSGILAAHNSLAKAYSRQGKYEKAVVGFKFVIKHNPYYTEPYNNLGVAYYKMGKLKEAVKYYLKALQLDPGYAEARHNLGVAYSRQGKYQEAVREYKEALSRLPATAKIHANLGQAYFYLGKKDEAQRTYKKALEYDPELAQAYLGLGQLADSGGDYAEAIKNYQRVIMLKPERVETYNELGNVYYMADRYQEALEIYRQALKLNPEAISVYNNLGLVYTALGRYREAVKAHRNAVKYDPRSPHAYNHLGFLYLHYLKQPAEALAYLRQSLAVAPRQPEAQQLKNTVQRLRTNPN